MASRIEANRTNVAAYVTGDAGITCDPGLTTLANGDRCEWGRLLAGTNEQISAQNAGVLVGARGCVYEIDGFNRIYAIAITWQGMTTGPAPIVDTGFAPNGCGRNMLGEPNENRRRVMTLPVRLGTVGA